MKGEGFGRVSIDALVTVASAVRTLTASPELAIDERTARELVDGIERSRVELDCLNRVVHEALADARGVMLCVSASDWQAHRAGLLDADGAELHGRWELLHGARVAIAPRHSSAAVRVLNHCNAHGVVLEIAGAPRAIEAAMRAGRTPDDALAAPPREGTR